MLSRSWRLKKLVLPIAAFLAWIPGGGLAQNADPNLCIPAMGGLAAAPTIDGRVDGDPGWNGATKVNLKQPGGTPRVGIMQLGRVGNNLYISLEVEGTPTPNENDLVVLGFSTTTNPAHDWRVHIFPFDLADTGTARSQYVNDPPRLQQTWRNSGVITSGTDAGKPTWNLASAVPLGTFIGETKVSRSNNNWAIEIRIPTTSVLGDAGGTAALYLPPQSAGTTFKFYANVLSTADLTPPLPSTFVEDPWPQNVPMLAAGGAGSGGDFAHHNTPLTTAWATASTHSRTECRGVYLAWNTPVGVRQNSTSAPGYSSLTGPGPFRAGGSPTGAILNTVEDCQTLADNTPWPAGTTLPNNFFIAKPGNDGTTSANGVSVKFYVAPWGIPGAFDAGAPDAYWHPAGELYRPSTMTTTVHTTTTPSPTPPIPPDVGGNPALASFLSTPSWQLSYKQACVYTKSFGYGIQGHHCIHAEVTSSDPTVRIRNKSIQINHNFMATASPVEREAEISLKGRGRPADRGKAHDVILFSHKLVQRFRRDGPRFFAAEIKPDVAPAARAGAAAAAAAVPTEAPLQFRTLGPVPAERFPKGVDEGMTVITNAYVRRSNSLIIGNKRYQRADHIGGYSYFAGHAGTAATNWTESVALKPGTKTMLGQAAALRSADPKLFEAKTPAALPISARMLQVAENDTATVTVRADPQDKARPPSSEPSQPSSCGCLDFNCRIRKADGGGALTVAGLFVFGGIGVGGIAFVRRRKKKPDEDEHSERQS